jgi:hypothetical protein
MRVGPDMRMAVVGSPGYFARHPRPGTPRDLTDHNCINTRLPACGSIFSWAFEKKSVELRVRAGAPHLQPHRHAHGRCPKRPRTGIYAGGLRGVGCQVWQLIRVPSDWCPPFPGYARSATLPRSPVMASVRSDHKKGQGKRVMPFKESDNSVTGIMESQQESPS